MKRFILKVLVLNFLSLLISFDAFSMQGFRKLDNQRGQISCPLYKNRLIASMQRLSEYDYVDKIKKKKFKVKDYEHLLTLYQRHEIPFLENEVLFFEASVTLSASQLDIVKQARQYKAESPFIKYETDRLLFPESALKVSLIEGESLLKIEMPLSYFQACLNSFHLNLEFIRNEESLKLNFEIDKHAYDLKNLNAL